MFEREEQPRNNDAEGGSVISHFDIRLGCRGFPSFREGPHSDMHALTLHAPGSLSSFVLMVSHTRV